MSAAAFGTLASGRGLHPDRLHKIHYLWRAVDDEGEVLDVIVQPRLDRKAALKLLRRLLKRRGYLPDAIVTDQLRSYGVASLPPNAAVYNHFNVQRHLISRGTLRQLRSQAFAGWREVAAA